MPAIDADTLNLISTAAEVLIAAGLMLTVVQIRWDHERSRRERAVTLLFEWARATDVKSEAARRFGDVLNFEQAKRLHQRKGFHVDASHRRLLLGVISNPRRAKNGQIWITAEQSAEIRYCIVRYLNHIEGVLAAWRHHVADRGIIEEQFWGFVSLTNKDFILEHYREAAGGKKTYPALAHFVSYVKVTEEKADQRHTKIG